MYLNSYIIKIDHLIQVFMHIKTKAGEKKFKKRFHDDIKETGNCFYKETGNILCKY